jgi:cation:H+ antiporter
MLRRMLDPGQVPPEVARARALSALWTFPGILFSAFVIGWGAEAAQFMVSRGLALALLAWLQTLPEFAVEAVIAWHRDIPLMTANFTGSLRLLTGVAWPLIYFTSAWGARKHVRADGGRYRVEMHREDAIGVMALLPPLLYFLWIWAKGSLTMVDSAILLVLYAAYLVAVSRMPPEEMEELSDLPVVSRRALLLPRPWNAVAVLALFVLGGVILYFVAHPFLESMLGLAVSLGVSQFVFVQWVSPFLSEFPEKVTAFNWARKPGKAPMALMNMVSSNVNQWTVLVAMIPMVYCASLGRIEPIPFDGHQRMEILLTLAQGFLGFMLLINLVFTWYEAVGLFVLWLFQFLFPDSHVFVTAVYFAWCGVEVVRILLGRRPLTALRVLPELLRHGRLAAKDHKPQ